MKKPLILICNDDGVTAPGIQSLIEAVRDLGDIMVVAPDKPQSGTGHGITINATLRMQKLREEEGLTVYSCSGTPVDCIKLAIYKMEVKPDVIISGINHGSNASINVIYSGTMSAAMEASINDIPALGFSLLDFSQDADFEPSKRYIGELIRYTLDNGLDNTKLLNVNIPKLPADKIKGIRICRQAEAQWVENFKEGLDPSQQPYFWLTGVFVNRDQGHDTDVWALSEGYVSVVPCAHDLTAYKAIGELKGLEN